MKIALIGKYGDGKVVSGPERVARELYKEYLRNGKQVVFVEYFFSDYKNSSIFKKLFGSEINSDSVKRLGIFSLIKIIFKERFDIIHLVNSQRFMQFLFLFGPLIKSKIISTLHGLVKFELPGKSSWQKKHFVDSWVEKNIVKNSDLLIFPSSLLLESFKNCYKFPEDKVRIIPNGVSNIFYQPNKFPTIENKLMLVFYNGLNNYIKRGLDELLNLLLSITFKLEIFIVGEVTELKSSGNIEIINAGQKKHDELINFLKGKHFVIKSPAFDTFSIFLGECMLSGLIPIVNEKTGMKDFIENGVNGFIYKSSSQTELVELLTKIHNGAYDLNMISENACKINQQLNWENIAGKYISAYESVL